MSKKISPAELAQIVVGLLVKPELFGELDTAEKHQAFMLDIGCVVAEHCGGEIYGISKPFGNNGYMIGDENSPHLAVTPDDSLRDLNDNVWTYFDRWADWEGEGIPACVPEKTEAEINEMRFALSHLLLSEDQSLIAAAKSTSEMARHFLGSAITDEESNIDDCRESFLEYDWKMKEGADETRFNKLIEKGKSGSITRAEVIEFVGLVDRESEKHIIWSIIEGARDLDASRGIIKKVEALIQQGV